MPTTSFNDFIVENNILGFFEKPITLKSGRSSHFYVNWRDATNDAFLLDQLTNHVKEFLSQMPLQFDTLYGVPEGATKTAVITALKLAVASPSFAKGSHVLAMGRAAPKPHGDPKDRYFIGAPRGRTVVLEDTTTTGGSLFNTIDHLLQQNIEVVAAVGLTDRMELRDEDRLSVHDAMERKYQGRISYFSLSNAIELIPLAVTKLRPSHEIRQGLMQEFSTYGVKPLALEGV
jgi:orotate phosphoribosyltransferase